MSEFSVHVIGPCTNVLLKHLKTKRNELFGNSCCGVATALK